MARPPQPTGKLAICFATLLGFSSLVCHGDTLTEQADEAQLHLGEKLNSLSQRIDSYFSREQVYGEVGASWGRIRTEISQIRDEDLDFKLRLKAKLLLPNTKRRLHLLIDGNDNDEAYDGDGPLNGGIGRISESTAPNARLAVRFDANRTDNRRISFDLGLRWHDDEAQVYLSNRFRLIYPLGSNWRGRLTNNLWLYSGSGLEDELKLDIEREIGSKGDKLFRASSTANWEENESDEQGTELTQQFAVYKQLSADRAIAAELIGIWQTVADAEHGEKFEGAEIRLRYRRRIWRPWLFMEVWPVVSWPASEDYDATFGGLIRFEAYFGDEKAWR